MQLASLSSLSDSELSKIIGLTVTVITTSEDEFTGVIYSVMKSNNLLALLSKDENEVNAVNSLMININHIKEIKLSNCQYTV